MTIAGSEQMAAQTILGSISRSFIAFEPKFEELQDKMKSLKRTVYEIAAQMSASAISCYR